MTVFADSSALVRRYVDEPGSKIVRGADHPLVVSHVCRVEIPSALWRKVDSDGLSPRHAGLLISAFETEWADLSEAAPFDVVPVIERILADASRAVRRHRLRSLDAIQLASALAARAASEEVQTFACFDDRLRTAAAAEGFALTPG